MRRTGLRGVSRVAYYASAAALPAAWDALVPKDHFLRSASLRLYEEAALPDVGFSYVLAWRGDEPVAAAYFQTLTIRAHHLNTAAIKGWQRAAWKGYTATTCPRLLVSGHLFRHDVRALYRRPDLEPFEAFKAFRAAVDETMRKTRASAVLIKDPPESMLTYFQQFAPEYLMLRSDISMEMGLQPAWQTFADYEKALKHKYAQRTRNVRKAAAGLVVRELSVEEVEARKEELYALYRGVTERQPVRLGFLSPELIPMLKRAQPDGLRVWGFFEDAEAEPDGRLTDTGQTDARRSGHGLTLRAFASAWVKESAFDMFYIGFDYEANARLQLYFNILFFAVEQAILLGKERLILGRTALEAKARLGCKPRYLQTALYIRNPVLRAWVARIQGRFSAGEGEWESRHPFKGG